MSPRPPQYVKIGKDLQPKSEIDVDMWHALTAEPGNELVRDAAVQWIVDRVENKMAAEAAAAAAVAVAENEEEGSTDI